MILLLGIRQTIKMVEAEGGKCKGYVVDISKKEEVYKAAEIVKREVGDVSFHWVLLSIIFFKIMVFVMFYRFFVSNFDHVDSLNGMLQQCLFN